MSLETHSKSVNVICSGCLSLDRNITDLKDEESRKFIFQETLGNLKYNSHPLLLCWECKAKLRGILKFKHQVRKACDYLLRCMTCSSHPPSLSHLTVVNQCDIDMCKYVFNSDIDNKAITVNMEQNIDNKDAGDHDNDYNDSLDHCDMHLPTDSHIYVMKENNLEDLSFQDNTNNEPVFGALVGNINKKDHVTDGDVDDNSKINMEFDESDEDPLTLKKTKNEDNEAKERNKDTPRVTRKTRSTDVSVTQNSKLPPDPGKQKVAKRSRKRSENSSGVVDNAKVRKTLKEFNLTAEQVQMVQLSWQEVAEERDRALRSEAFTRQQYRCYDCVLGFNHKSKLQNHMRKHEPCAGSVECTVCSVRLRHARALYAHRRRHRVRWRCCECGATYSRASVAVDHYTRKHGAPTPTHLCNVCGHKETTRNKLLTHIKQHADPQKCELCGKMFRDKNCLRMHLFIHKAEKEYACPQCDKRFLFKKAMEIHLVTHDAPAQLYCIECDVNFKNRMTYYQHMKYNLKHIDQSRLKHACELCEKKFTTSTRLQEHHYAVHLKVTPVKCPEEGCKFACSTRAILRSHKRAVHCGIRPQRKHMCHTCGKCYSTKKALEAHIHSHTGARPHRCGSCPATFTYQAALYNHNKLVHLKLKGGAKRQQNRSTPTNWNLALDVPHSSDALNGAS